MKKIPVLICDDQDIFIKLITKKIKYSESLLKENFSEKQVSLEVKQTLSTYNQALNFIESRIWKGGIYFLDVDLKSEHTGLDLAEKIKNIDKEAQFIFVTSHHEMAFLTFERRLGPVDYIVKVEDELKFQERLNVAIQQAVENILLLPQKKLESFEYKVGRKVFRINLDEVEYIETAPESHKLSLVKKSGFSLISGNLKIFEERYPSLVKISQSCLLNPRYVKKINKSTNTVVLEDSSEVRYSRKLRKVIEKILTI